MTDPPTGHLTFLFTDIEGSTRMWEKEPAAMRSALVRHDEILKATIEQHGGHVFKTVGDAFCAVFGEAPDAVGAGLAGQRALYAENWDDGCVIRARMALHAGEAEERGGDYFGPTLNRVARLLSAGHGGQTLLSLAARTLAGEGLPHDAELRDMGERRLKDLTHPEHVFQLAIPDLPDEFPPLKTLDAIRNNLPLQPTPLIGRERQVEMVCEELRQKATRLLTLIGPGGTGKTRLSLQVAAEMLDEYPDGVLFVDLAPLNAPTLVATAIARTLGLTETAEQTTEESLKEYVRPRELLLVLDNFEQVLEAAPLVGELLASGPALEVIATSRAALGVYGEREYAVPPLELPDPERLPSVDDLNHYEAVRLFVERARAVKRGFAVTNENAQAVAEICTRLDGLPLAIELAAARARILTPQAMLKRLGDRLKLLTGGARNLPERQQTIRGAIEWSHDLLDEDDRTLFRRMSVFSGGRTFEAMEAVCAPEGEPDVLDGVQSLAEKSLLRQEEGPEDEPRFVMLETIHEFAREKLEESGEAEETSRLHAEYFLALAEEAEPELRGSDQAGWMDRLEAEHDNLRAALSWSLGGGEAETALGICGALWYFWSVRGHWSEGIRWCEEALKRGESMLRTAQQTARAKALLGAGDLLYVAGDLGPSAERLEGALELYGQIGDRRGRAACLGYLGAGALDRGDLEQAESLLEESLALARESGSRWNIQMVLHDLGYLAVNRGDLERANGLFEEALAVARAAGDTSGTASVINGLASTAMLGGDHGRAEKLFEEGLELSRIAGNRNSEAITLNNSALFSLYRGDLARAVSLSSESLRISEELLDRAGVNVCLDALAAVSSELGDVSGAARLWGAAEALREAQGLSQPPDDKEILDPFLEAARSRLAEADWKAAWEEGRTMTEKQAVALALEVGDQGEEARVRGEA